MSNRDESKSDEVLEALGDRTRREILSRLRQGPLPVGELAAVLPVGRPAVSKHLRVLEGAGLVRHDSVGTRNLYALAPEGLVALQQWLVQTWDVALTAFAGRVADDYHHREEHHDESAADPATGSRAG